MQILNGFVVDQSTEIVHRSYQLDRPFSVFFGAESLNLQILAEGCVGLISLAAKVIPGVMKELITSYDRRELKESRFIMQAIHGFCKALLTVRIESRNGRENSPFAGQNLHECVYPGFGLIILSIAVEFITKRLGVVFPILAKPMT